MNVFRGGTCRSGLSCDMIRTTRLHGTVGSSDYWTYHCRGPSLRMRDHCEHQDRPLRYLVMVWKMSVTLQLCLSMIRTMEC